MRTAHFAMLSLFLAAPSYATNFQADRDAIEQKQAELDQACEAARTIKLQPIREQAFEDCMRSPRSTDTEADCRRKTDSFDGARAGGTPKFYDLPECEAAFKHRKANPKFS